MDNKARNIYIATFSAEAEETAKKYGFGLELNDLCISSNLEKEKREWVINRMRTELERADCTDRKTIMHGPFTELTPAAIDPRAIALMKDRYLSAIDICRSMGINDLVLHDGYIPLIYQKPWHLKRSVMFWKEFGEFIPEGFRVYIENVFDDEPELLIEIVDTVNEKIGMPKGEEKYSICLDVGHANAMAKMHDKGRVDAVSKVSDAECINHSTEIIVEWIRKMGSLIGHFHLHNNDGTGDQHDDVNLGSFDIVKVLEAVETYCRPDVTMTIESRNAEPSAGFLYKWARG